MILFKSCEDLLFSVFYQWETVSKQNILFTSTHKKNRQSTEDIINQIIILTVSRCCHFIFRDPSGFKWWDPLYIDCVWKYRKRASRRIWTATSWRPLQVPNLKWALKLDRLAAGGRLPVLIRSLELGVESELETKVWKLNQQLLQWCCWQECL